MKNLSILLLKEQNRLELTNIEMSLRCDLSLREYQKLISGKSNGCRVETIIKIAENTNIDYLDMFYPLRSGQISPSGS